MSEQQQQPLAPPYLVGGVMNDVMPATPPVVGAPPAAAAPAAAPGPMMAQISPTPEAVPTTPTEIAGTTGGAAAAPPTVEGPPVIPTVDEEEFKEVTLQDFIDPALVARLEQDAKGEMSLPEIVGLAGLAATDPYAGTDLAKQALSQRHARYTNALNLLTSLQGQVSSYNKYRRQVRTAKEKESEGLMKTAAQGLQAAARTSGVSIGAMPLSGDRQAFEKWLQTGWDKVGTAQYEQQRREFKLKSFKLVNDTVAAQVQNGFFTTGQDIPAMIEGGLLSMGWAPEEVQEAKKNPLYSGPMSMVANTGQLLKEAKYEQTYAQIKNWQDSISVKNREVDALRSQIDKGSAADAQKSAVDLLKLRADAQVQMRDLTNSLGTDSILANAMPDNPQIKENMRLKTEQMRQLVELNDKITVTENYLNAQAGRFRAEQGFVTKFSASIMRSMAQFGLDPKIFYDNPGHPDAQRALRQTVLEMAGPLASPEQIQWFHNFVNERGRLIWGQDVYIEPGTTALEGAQPQGDPYDYGGDPEAPAVEEPTAPPQGPVNPNDPAQGMLIPGHTPGGGQ